MAYTGASRVYIRSRKVGQRLITCGRIVSIVRWIAVRTEGSDSVLDQPLKVRRDPMNNLLAAKVFKEVGRWQGRQILHTTQLL